MNSKLFEVEPILQRSYVYKFKDIIRFSEECQLTDHNLVALFRSQT